MIGISQWEWRGALCQQPSKLLLAIRKRFRPTVLSIADQQIKGKEARIATME